MNGKTPRIVGYWENWEFGIPKGTSWGKLTDENLNTNQGCTHAVYSFMTLAAIPDPKQPSLTEEWDGNIYCGSGPSGANPIVKNNVVITAGEDNGEMMRLLTFVKAIQKADKYAILSLGGWSDIQNTPKFTESDPQLLVDSIKALNDYTKADGFDFDWEHLGNHYHMNLGNIQVDEQTIVDRCIYLGIVMKKLQDIGIKVSYTTRANTYVPYVKGIGSDCEGIAVMLGSQWNGEDKNTFLQSILSEFKKARNNTLPPYNNYTMKKIDIPCSFVNIMTYDGAVGTMAPNGQYTFQMMKDVLNQNSFVSGFSLDKLLIGFEPIQQANAYSIPMEDSEREKTIDYIFNNNTGGFILWAMNDRRPLSNLNGTYGVSKACVEIANKAFTRLTGKQPPNITIPPSYGCNKNQNPSTCIPYNQWNTTGLYWTDDCDNDCTKEGRCKWYQTLVDGECTNPNCPTSIHSIKSQNKQKTFLYLEITLAIFSLIGILLTYFLKFNKKNKLGIFIFLGIVWLGSVILILIPTSSDKVYKWHSDNWSPNPCNSGSIQTRKISCIDQYGNIVVNTYCKDPKPSSERNCPTQHSYTWQKGSWTPDPCNPDSTQTQTYICVDDLGNPSPNKCKDDKPMDNIRDCPTKTHTYNWNTTEWTPDPCDTGTTQTRKVTCTDENGDLASSESICKKDKPSNSRNCPTTQCGDCKNCLYPETKACYTGWTKEVCNSSGYIWCGDPTNCKHGEILMTDPNGNKICTPCS